jgi:hypothetical protein
VIERKHPDGSWEPVESEGFVSRRLGPNWYWTNEAKTAVIYLWFAKLSGRQHLVPPESILVEDNRFPEDVSIFTRDALSLNVAPARHAIFLLSDLRRLAPGHEAPIDELLSTRPSFGSGLDDNDPRASADCYLRLLEGILDRLVASGPHGVLQGRERDPITGDRFPDFNTESAHARLRRVARERELLPMSDDTLRVLAIRNA